MKAVGHGVKMSEYCSHGWNDQNPYSHSTNIHLAVADKTVYLRISPAVVLVIPVCDEHYNVTKKFCDMSYSTGAWDK